MGDPAKGKKVGWDGVFAFLVVLRIAPFPPHWIANFVAPHLGIGVGLFWAACFVGEWIRSSVERCADGAGIAPVSVIHVTIGSSLDSMTSAEDFHILSLRNILGLSAVIVAVLIPVGLKRVFRKDLGELGEAEEDLSVAESIHAEAEDEASHAHAIDSGVCLAPPSAGPYIKGKGKALQTVHDEDEEQDDVDDEPTRDLYPVPVAPVKERQRGYGTMDSCEPLDKERAEERPGGRWWLLGY